MAYANIEVETHDKAGLIRLNRPNALNALNAALIDELGAALDAFECNNEIGCIIITGSPKAFAAGADIKEMQEKTYAEAYLDDFILSWERVSRTRKPIIAAVAGFAVVEVAVPVVAAGDAFAFAAGAFIPFLCSAA